MKKETEKIYERFLFMVETIPLLRPKKNKIITCCCVTGVLLIAMFRLVVTNDDTPDFDNVALGASSPKEVVERWYNAYKDGDAIAMLNCIDYTEDEKLCIFGPLSERMRGENWQKRTAVTCFRMTYECEKFESRDSSGEADSASANVYVEASSEYEGSSKSAGRIVYMKKINGKWFVCKSQDSLGFGICDVTEP